MAEAPVPFERGMPIAAEALNALQRAILRALAAHDHTGGDNGPPLGPEALADGAVGAAKLADAAVTARTLAPGAVAAGALGDAAVTARALGDGAVGTAALQDGAVTEAKLSAALRQLIRARADQVSSSSQVVWRDPLVVFAPPVGAAEDIGILDTIAQADLVYWHPSVVALDTQGRAVQLRPGQGGARVAVMEIAEDDPRTQPLRMEMEARVLRAADTIADLGAMRWRDAGGATGGGLGGATAAAGTVGATARVAARAVEGRATTAVGAGADPEVMSALALSSGGAQMARRMTALVSLDPAGRAAGVEAAGPRLEPAFSGKESFLAPGEEVSYTALDSAADRTRAARGMAATLYNLGFDAEYLARSDRDSAAVKGALQQALAGDPAVFDPDGAIWRPGGWLPEILERPELFGSGYALAGGRNVLDVTRQTGDGGADRWVRVRFVTPYRDAAYAVAVTPAVHPDFALIAPMVRNKRRDGFEIVFRALRPDGDGVETLDKLDFDLSVVGELERG